MIRPGADSRQPEYTVARRSSDYPAGLYFP